MPIFFLISDSDILLKHIKNVHRMNVVRVDTISQKLRKCKSLAVELEWLAQNAVDGLPDLDVAWDWVRPSVEE